MNIDDLTIKQIKEISGLINSPSTETAFGIGKNYFIRTATYHCTGKLEKITTAELVLSKAAWIADSGRLHNALKNESFDEVEPFINELIVSRYGIIDATVITKLPEEQC